jgi:hypothetical protein
MRRAGKIDRNQPEIVEKLREIGATVQILSAVGKGCPDLLVGFQGRNLLLEVKDGDLVPSARKLTPDQLGWHREWHGQVTVVDDWQMAVLAVTGKP